MRWSALPPYGSASVAGAARRGWSPRLTLDLVLYEIRKSDAGSVLGIAWAIAQPLLFLGAYWFLLTILDARNLGRGGTEGQVVMLLAALVPWLFFARSLGRAPSALTGHATLVKQINFPVAALPFVSVGVQAVEFAVGLLVLALATAVTGSLSWSFLLLAPVSACFAIFQLSLTAMLGPLAVMLRDVRRLIPIVLRAGLFLTPVLYLPSALPEGTEFLAYLNPVAYFIALFRYGVTSSADVFVVDLATDAAIAGGVTAAVAIAGFLAWRSAEATIVDHL